MRIIISNIGKSYGKTKIIEGFNCTINQGLYGVLGRNGAGKTTLFRMIAGLIKKTSGDIIFEVNGSCIKNKDIEKYIGYLPQEFGMYPEFTVLDIMEEISIIRGISKKRRKEEIEMLLDKVNMSEHKKKRFKDLSGGMKRRLGLAQAMMGNPKILIVDEPTAGVDPKERIYIRKILSEYAKDNIVLLSTHLVEDIEHICEELLIIEKGKLLFQGTVEDLILESSKYIGIKEFYTLEDFQNYTSENEIFTFKRESNRILAMVDASKSDAKACNISLEDAYMWMISKGEGK
ncbi:MAG: ATP-binding cassette domain-containing protein [Clostridia bacterium]|nr:ATP-binding cassette domain-containing protein [Clostridia bacterium]